MIKVGVLEICHHVVNEYEEVDYSVDPLFNYSKHPPTCFHSFAAATNGMVVNLHDSQTDIDKLSSCDMVLIHANVNPLLAIDVSYRLKELGKVVLLSYHENIKALNNIHYMWPNYTIEFIETLETGFIDALLFSTPLKGKLLWEFISERASKPVEYCPTTCACPRLENILTPIDKRKGIIIGTRHFDIEITRNTLQNLILTAKLSNQYDVPVTFVFANIDPSFSHHIDDWYKVFDKQSNFNLICGNKHIVHRVNHILSYLDCVRLISKHRICINLDWAMSQGDVPGDCMWVNVPCIGGNGNIQDIAFSSIKVDDTNLDQVYDTCGQLLTDDNLYGQVCFDIEQKFLQNFTYDIARQRLTEIYNKYRKN